MINIHCGLCECNLIKYIYGVEAAKMNLARNFVIKMHHV